MRFAPPIFVTFVLIALAGAAPPPGIMVAKDRPDDAGDALIVEWTLPEGMEPTGYRIQARPVRKGITRPDGKPWTDFVLLAEPAPGDTTAVIDGLTADERFEVQIEAVDADGVVLWAASSGVVAPKVNWFNLSRAWLAILLGVVCGAVLVYITAARRGMKLWVRPIAGLQAVTDAVGRAVEMGKSVLFVPGLLDINDIQTVAGITILSRVARIAAEYDAEIKVPTARSLVMATARETVEASFLHAGRPDSYNADDVYYLTDEQFGFVAGVTGPMLREKPAACFYMGAFYAESLILAETGNAIGSIQVAGTAMPSQLPFFIAACDYTLIGEEFFAASAYLSGEPQQLGSLKGQDFGKVMCAALILAGCLLATIVSLSDSPPAGVERSLEYLQANILGDAGLTLQEQE